MPRVPSLWGVPPGFLRRLTGPPAQRAPRVAPAALSAMEGFQAKVVRDVQESVRLDRIVVGMSQNAHVPKVRNALDEAGVAYTYLEYGSYFSKWRERLAIKLWSGWPTFPQVFVNGTLIGGEDPHEGSACRRFAQVLARSG